MHTHPIGFSSPQPLFLHVQSLTLTSQSPTHQAVLAEMQAPLAPPPAPPAALGAENAKMMAALTWATQEGCLACWVLPQNREEPSEVPSSRGTHHPGCDAFRYIRVVCSTMTNLVRAGGARLGKEDPQIALVHGVAQRDWVRQRLTGRVAGFSATPVLSPCSCLGNKLSPGPGV